MAVKYTPAPRVGNCLLYMGLGMKPRPSFPRDSEGFEPLEAYFPKDDDYSNSDSDTDTEAEKQRIQQKLLEKEKASGVPYTIEQPPPQLPVPRQKQPVPWQPTPISSHKPAPQPSRDFVLVISDDDSVTGEEDEEMVIPSASGQPPSKISRLAPSRLNFSSEEGDLSGGGTSVTVIMNTVGGKVRVAEGPPAKKRRRGRPPKTRDAGATTLPRNEQEMWFVPEDFSMAKIREAVRSGKEMSPQCLRSGTIRDAKVRHCNWVPGNSGSDSDTMPRLKRRKRRQQRQPEEIEDGGGEVSNAVEEHTNPTPGVQRSKRVRIPPIQPDQQIEYNHRRESGVSLEGPLQRGKDTEKKRKVVDKDHPLLHYAHRATGVPMTTKAVFSRNSAFRETVHGDSPEDGGSDVIIEKLVMKKFFSLGIFTFPPSAEKESCDTDCYDMYFYVTKGKVLITVNETTHYCIDADYGAVNVPPGTTYSIRNLRNSPAEVHYTAVIHGHPT